MYAVDSDIAETRLCTANLYVLAFAFVAFERHAWRTANGIRDVGIGKTGDHPGRQHLHDVVRRALNVDGFGLALNTLGGDDDLFAHRENL